MQKYPENWEQKEFHPDYRSNKSKYAEKFEGLTQLFHKEKATDAKKAVQEPVCKAASATWQLLQHVSKFNQWRQGKIPRHAAELTVRRIE